jgi:hypothetical protein
MILSLSIDKEKSIFKEENKKPRLWQSYPLVKELVWKEGSQMLFIKKIG